MSLTNLEKAHYYFRDFESPAHFIDWNLLYAVASCLGRKVWFQGGQPIFPNIYVIIVGDPGLGKSMPAEKFYDIISAMQKVDDKGKTSDLVNMVPHCVTLERLYQVLSVCGDAVRLPNDKVPYFHSSASFLLAGEMGMLFKKSDKIKDLVLFLNGGYDNMTKFKYETKSKGIDVITNLCVNFFGCCTPSWVSENVGSGLIDNGFSSRVFWVFGAEKRQSTTFYNYTKEQTASLDELKIHFRKIASLCGEVYFTPEALEYFDSWYKKDFKKSRVNHDSKLDYYYARKKLHVLKIAMLIHFSEKTDMLVTLEELKFAFKILAEAEMDMHKALASVNANPTARLAEDIKRDLKSNNGMTKAEILVKHFSKGGLPAIDEALQYLMLTEQVTGSSGGKYCLTKKIIEFPKQAAGDELEEQPRTAASL